MNRDEQRTRVTALPPALHQVQGRAAVFPSEPSGGTWIGVNDAGITLALVNWYSIKAHISKRAVSRGEVVRRTLPAASFADADSAVTGLPLHRIRPFRLIGVFPAQRRVQEWRWNLKRLEQLTHRWQSNTWISSGFDEPGAQRVRGRHFRHALHQRSAGQLDWIQRLHRSHHPERGPYSTCMHREDAATVSFTLVSILRRTARIHYTPGPPCCTAATRAIELALDRS